MAPKFEINLVKVVNNQNTYCSHESGVIPPAQPVAAPSRSGWLVWAARFVKVVVFCVRVYLTFHGVDPDPVGLAVLGYGFITDVKAWIVERCTK